MDNYRYYIDGVLQAYVPTPPDPSAKLTLDSVAAIGHPDVIDREYCGFKVWSIALDQAAVTTSYDEWYQCYIAATPTVELIDDNGIALVDNAGNTLIV